MVKNIAKYRSYKELLSKIFKEYLKLNKKTTQLEKKKMDQGS